MMCEHVHKDDGDNAICEDCMRELRKMKMTLYDKAYTTSLTDGKIINTLNVEDVKEAVKELKEDIKFFLFDDKDRDDALGIIDKIFGKELTEEDLK